MSTSRVAGTVRLLAIAAALTRTCTVAAGAVGAFGPYRVLFLGHGSFSLFKKLSKSPVAAGIPAVGNIAGYIHELALFLARRALLRGFFSLERVSAFGTFPVSHFPGPPLSMAPSYAFQRP